MFNFARIISKINPANTIMPRIVNLFSMNSNHVINPAKSAQRSIASDWRKIGEDMERGLIRYDRDLTRRTKFNGFSK
ncbi:hypothetical protein [Lactiplantibacillus pentosus]|uniref:hypothetical protein n=1 Tax=Lactiplantibacillus pentosus TaxID=1589 RepID=UPI002348F223|nr:hypothetical protein [Lactiplantibacillus pentosus]MDC6398038.1 hypothetical protein [Lactiplantibacillus pentosus]